MRKSNLLVAALAATALATLVLAQNQADRKWLVIDSTTYDQSMSGGTPSVPCGANLDGIGVKCSGDSTYRSVPVGNFLQFKCPSDASLNFIDLQDTEDYGTVSWTCDSNTVRDLQNVTITGELSTCREGMNLTANSVCIID